MKHATYIGKDKQDEAVVMGIKLGQDLTSLFATRGWSLYKSPEQVGSLDDLRGVIEQGAAGTAEPFQRYILLPSTTAPDNPDEVFRTAQTLIRKGRYPFFVDVAEDHSDHTQKPTARATYLIDAVMLSLDRVLLQIDLDAMLALGMDIPREIMTLQNPCIAFDALEMYDKINQVTRSYH